MKLTQNNMTDKELYNLCQTYGKNARMWSRKFASLLPEVEKRKLYKKYGFYSIFEFAAKLGGLSKKTVEEVLRVYQKVKDKPLLKAEVEKQGWGKVRAVTSIVESESEERLVNMVKTLPKKALEECVREVKKQNEQSGKFPPGWKSQPGWENESKPEIEEKWTQMSFKVDPETEFRLRKFQKKLEREKKEKVSFNEVLKALLDGVEEKPKKVRKTKKSIKTTRYISAKIKQTLHQKYNGKCGYPACNKPHDVLHHINRFALSKNHKSVIPLCTEHHQIAHAGLIEHEQEPEIKWQLQKTPNKGSPMYIVDKKVQRFRNDR